MTDRVLGPGATGAGEDADQTDPPESTVEETYEEAAPTLAPVPDAELRVPPTPPPADPAPAQVVAQ